MGHKYWVRKIGKWSSDGVPFLVILAMWWGMAHARLIDEAFLPSPEKVFETFIRLTKDGILLPNIGLSILRVLKGFLIGLSFGFVLGTLMGLSRTAEKVIGPTFNAIRQIPLVAWIPLIIIWFGIGEMSKLVFIAIGAMYPIVFNTLEGIRNVPKGFVEVARVFEYNQIKLVQKVILPAALPSFLTGVRLSLSRSWMMVIGAEVFMSTVERGLGNMIEQGSALFQLEIVFVGIIVIAFIGLAMNYLVGLVEAHFAWGRQ